MIAWLNQNRYLAVAVAGLVLLAGLGARDVLLAEDAPILTIGEAGLEPGTPIRVHVAGAVVVPGVYELAAGQRVEDALRAAGGAAQGADLDSVNLARRLRDGEQVFIEGSSAQAPSVLTPGEPLDLNLATRDQLMALPGIGEAYSLRIVDSRVVDGSFSSVDELLERGLVPARTLESIRTLVTVSSP